jgi:hypothetical protein
LTQNPGTTSPGDNGQTPPPGDQTGQTPPPQSQTQSGQQQQQKTDISSLPPDVQDYIRLLRDEAKTTRQQLEAEARAKQQADEDRLKRQGEFQKLAEQREAEVNRLKTYETRFTSLAEQTKAFIDAQTKDWPEIIKDYDPGPDADVEARIAWMNKSRPHAEKLAVQTRGQAPGNSPNPPPANQGTSEQDVSELRRRIRESGKINF